MNCQFYGTLYCKAKTLQYQRENPNSHVTPSIKTGYFIVLAIFQTVLKIQKYNEHELKCKFSGLMKILD